jgi:shikimate kinase
VESEIMQGYYDHHPTHRLERSLALVSFVNHMTRTVAHRLACMTGLPLSLLDELVEHQVGASSHKAIRENGLSVWREVEKTELAKAIASQPPTILALGEGALGDPDNLRLSLEAAELVYLFMPGDQACHRASLQPANHGASFWAEVEARGGVPEEAMRELFEGRHFAYGLAHYTLDASRQSLSDTANQLLDRLPVAR